MGLGKFSKYIQTPSELDVIIEDVQNYLNEYLKEEEKRINANVENRDFLFEDCLFPENYINSDDSFQMKQYITIPESPEININIISLNYTHSIETLIGTQLPIEFEKGGRKGVISKIIHVHGELDDVLLFGVDNPEQIDNPEWQENLDVLDLLCKPNINKSLEKGDMLRDCKEIMGKTDVFILFGLSCGSTDGYWWSLIGDKLGNGNDFFVMVFDYNDSQINRRHLAIYKRKIKDRILDFLPLEYSRDDMEEYYDLMVVPLNRDLFKRLSGIAK